MLLKLRNNLPKIGNVVSIILLVVFCVVVLYMLLTEIITVSKTKAFIVTQEQAVQELYDCVFLPEAALLKDDDEQLLQQYFYEQADALKDKGATDAVVVYFESETKEECLLRLQQEVNPQKILIIGDKVPVYKLVYLARSMGFDAWGTVGVVPGGESENGVIYDLLG